VADSVGGDHIEAAVEGAENTVIGKDIRQAITNPSASNNITFNSDDASQLFQAIQAVNQSLSLGILAFKQEIGLAFSELKQTMALNTSIFNERFDNQGRRISSVEDAVQVLRREVAEARVDTQTNRAQMKSFETQVQDLSTKMTTAATQHQVPHPTPQNSADNRILIVVFVLGTSLGAAIIALVSFALMRGG
jgi:uncharacterized coiled-coil protein SlyX